jgi:hypothetical protein
MPTHIDPSHPGRIMIVAALAMLAFDASAQTPIDGNTVRLDAVTYRLWAIDAPDTPQTCNADWPAGRKAAETLAALMRGRTVTCEAKTRDRARQRDRALPGRWRGSRRRDGPRRHGVGVHQVQQRLPRAGEGGDQRPRRRPRARL